VKIAITTTVDCSGNNAPAPQWKIPDRTSPMIVKGNNATEKEQQKQNEPHTSRI
jgi:hypothetical protein